MTNEEKAREFAYYFCNEKSCDDYECIDCPKARTHPALIKMAKWKQEQMIQKAIHFLDDSRLNYVRDYWPEFIEDFKQAMEE